MFVPRIQDAPRPVIIQPPSVTHVVTKIALTCLKEFTVSLAFGFAVSCFVSTPAGIALMVSATLVQFAVSAFFHSLGAFASYKVAQKGPNLIHFERLLSVCEWVTGSNFALFTGLNSQYLIHETGHTLAALSIYKRPRPLIEIYPYIGGITQFYKTSLTPFGKKIGPVAATCLVIASGPAFTLLISSILLSIGLSVKEKYPQFSKYLIAWGVVDFLNHAYYAYSALGADQSNLSHDFVHLSIFGLHPVVATISILAIPIVITMGMNWWKSRQQQKPLPTLALA